MHSSLNVVHTHTFSPSCRLQLCAAVLVMVHERAQRVPVLVGEEALHDLDGSDMVRRSGELLLPCLPSGELAWRAAMGLTHALQGVHKCCKTRKTYFTK